ncbi:MAG: Nitrogen regulation protein ntrY [Myxococcaceae bacterium]|nr:Nitrogen regulation protein ntrY [Myxococcaceae bacterium]
MVERRLAIVFALGLASVIAATWASAALSLTAHQRALRARSLRVAHSVRTAYDRDTKTSQLLLQHICTRDVQVVRLAAELGAGGTGGEDAPRMALSLGRALAADAWLLLERDGALTVLGASSALPPKLPSTNALGAGSGRPIILDGESPRFLTACARQVGKDALWVVRTEPVSHARRRWLGSDTAQFLDLPSGRSSGDDQHADALALRIPRADTGDLTELWVRVAEAPHFDALLMLLPMAVLVVVFGGGLAYMAVTREPLDDTVLVELEQAAERVAKGDLSARIGTRSGGRADQTFRTFDRMTEELSEMRSKLAEAERAAAWQDMARRIAHEIKNPLSPIQTAIETLRKAHAQALPEFDEIFDESTRAIAEEVRRIEHIVREFSDFARLPRAKPGALELSSLIADTVALYQPDDVKVEVSSSAKDTLVRADREQITQVLVNLIQNGTDAARSAAGGATPRVLVSTEISRGMALVHVDDSGRGIAPEERERVFEPYYTTKAHGTGLGLAIVRRIALDHQGQVHVSASALGGARFTLKLPLQAS